MATLLKLFVLRKKNDNNKQYEKIFSTFYFAFFLFLCIGLKTSVKAANMMLHFFCFIITKKGFHGFMVTYTALKIHLFGR